MQPIPFRLFLLAHPKSGSAGLLAQELMRRFVEPPASGGLRLPVWFTPDRGDGLPPAWDGDEGINLDAAQHTLVVVLADARMARQVTLQGERGTGAEWAKFLAEGAVRAPVGQSPHHVFGVAIAKPCDDHDTVDDSCFALGGPRHMLGVVKEPAARGANESRDDYAKRIEPWLKPTAEEIALHVTIRAIHLLEKGVVPADASPELKAPVRLFLSHAKADLKSDEADVVRQVEDAIKELPIEAWFDAGKIRPGATFETEITAGLRDCSILIAFLTDHYALRPWCQREVLDAKRLGAPILVVDALSSWEPRSFPYLGNVPTVHWTGKEPKAEARQIVSRAVREALRFKHNRAVLQQRAGPGETVVASAPEALTLAWNASAGEGKETFLYPDPPLAKAELDVLKGLRPNATFVTPFTKVAHWQKPAHVHALAVSTSVSNDKERLGLSRTHEEAIFDELHGYFLLAGLQIAYGGALQADIRTGTNFTLRLFELVRAYSRIAADAGASQLKPILNFAPWPLWRTYGEDDLRLFGIVADLVGGNRPPANEVPEKDEELFPAGTNIHTLPETPERRLAWARGLTAMRWQITQQTQAKVVVGGTLVGFKGLYPGVVEEAWLSVVSGQPLFLIGAFGGAARAVIDLLQGHERPELSTAGLAATVPSFQAVVDLAKQRQLTLMERGRTPTDRPPNLAGKLVLPDVIVADLQAAGQSGLDRALNNQLTADENRELFRSLDPPRIAELVLRGLGALGQISP